MPCEGDRVFGMTYTGSTGATWLDFTIMGIGIAFVPVLVAVVLLARPGSSLAPMVAEGTLVLGLLGAFFLVAGVWYGKRTRWKVPDPGKVRAR